MFLCLIVRNNFCFDGVKNSAPCCININYHECNPDRYGDPDLLCVIFEYDFFFVCFRSMNTIFEDFTLMCRKRAI